MKTVCDQRDLIDDSLGLNTGYIYCFPVTHVRGDSETDGETDGIIIFYVMPYSSCRKLDHTEEVHHGD